MPAPVQAAPPSAPIVTPPAPSFTESASPSPRTTSIPSSPATEKSSSPKSEPLNNAFDGLDDMMGMPEPKPKAPEEKPKPEVKPEVKNEEDIEIEPDKPKETPKPKETKTGGAATLRTAYENVKKRAAELEQEVAALKSAKPADDPNVKTYKERWEAAEKRREELEKELKFSAYERSDDYNKEYHAPFESAYKLGRAKVSALKIIERTDEATGTVKQASRQATAEDFDRIMRADSEEDAAELADQLFGSKAVVALYHRQRVEELNERRHNALVEFQTKGLEREQMTAREKALQSEQLTSMWQTLNKDTVEKHPKLFKPDESDPEGNAILEKGYKLADLAFTSKHGLTDEELVKVHTQLRNRAAAFPREVYRNQKLEARVAELEKELEQYKASEPGPGEGTGEKAESEFPELMADR